MPPRPILLPTETGRRRTLKRIGAATASLALGAIAGAASRPAHADTIVVKSAELRVDEDDYVLNAEFDLNINSTLEEALQRGIPLYFLLEFEVVRARWYWLPEKVVSSLTQYRIAWNALTQQYRVSSGLFAQTLFTLDEVERFLSRVNSRPVAKRDQLPPGVRYDAALRLRLDVNQLPKPFQVNALVSREWSLQSDWYRWSFTA